MSDQLAVRAVALSESVKLHTALQRGETPTEDIVKTASTFLAFLLGPVQQSAKVSAAGAEPTKKAEDKPSANTAGAKKTTATKVAKKSEEQLAAEALEKANAEAELDEAPEITDPIEATAAGVALAVKTMLERDKADASTGLRDKAIALLKKFKASGVTAMQKQPEDKIIEFVNEANELLGLGADPDLGE